LTKVYRKIGGQQKYFFNKMFKEYLEEDGKNAIDGRPAGIIKILKNV